MKGCVMMRGNYLVPTGSIIKEYLEEYRITQKELAERIDSSEKHISNVLKGNNRVTEEFALKLEKVITSVPASYWLNYEAKYREQIAREEELLRVQNWDLRELAKRFRFKEVFKGLELSVVEQAIEMLKLLKISDYRNFESVYGNIAVNFMQDGGEKEAIAIWLNMCEAEIEIQNAEIDDIDYKETNLMKNLEKIKLLAYNNKTDASINSCRKLLNKIGIYLVFCEPVTNSKVRGALTSYKGHPVIYLSGRFKTHAHTWFALAHEIGHLLLHYSKTGVILSFEDGDDSKEQQANQFAREFFVDTTQYDEFSKRTKYTADEIRKFAKGQKVLPEFVVGMLKHDGKIEHNQFNYI